MNKPNILVIDDEPMISGMLYEVLKKKPFNIKIADNGKIALDLLNREQFDLVITDVYLPDLNGLEILRLTKEKDPDTGVIVITAHSSVESAVEAIKEGAYDYLTKGFSLDEIELTVDKFFKYQRLVKENAQLKFELGKRYNIENIVGNSPEMKKVFETIEMVAPTNATVLLQGASGTGKEVIAKAIHQLSDRKDMPFIKTNLAAIPEGLAESELFGHEKGSFTGAIRSTKGRFEMADAGTLLLDEISETTINLQTKLLRVLQEKEFEKVGNPTPIKVDVRIVATTNRQLQNEVSEGNFREDLFYRLNVVPIRLPRLKERKVDIPLLVGHFIEKYSAQNNRTVKKIDASALNKLMKHNWPGNVRELENTIERAVVICKEGSIKTKHLFLEDNMEGIYRNKTTQSENLPDDLTLKKLERLYILKVLKESNGNKTHAAQKLGITGRTLRNKLNEYKADGHQGEED